MPADELIVEFLGEEYPVRPEASLSFGRTAELSIDDNPHLHRRLGSIDHAEGLWWLHNLGSAITIEVADRNSPSRLALAPGATMALVFEECALRFRAGTTAYELRVEVPLAPPVPHRGGGVGGPEGTADDGTRTVTAADLAFTADQLRLVVALAEPRLRDPSSVDLPTNRAAAARLGWKLTRFNRKLDNVCTKVGGAGVPGLHGDVGSLATKRRERLVDFAVAANLVTVDDLGLLDEPI